MPEGFGFRAYAEVLNQASERVEQVRATLGQQSATAADFGDSWGHHGADFESYLTALADDLANLSAHLGDSGRDTELEVPDAESAAVDDGDAEEIIGSALDDLVDEVLPAYDSTLELSLDPSGANKRQEISGLRLDRIGKDVAKLDGLATAMDDIAVVIKGTTVGKSIVDYVAAVRTTAAGLETALDRIRTEYTTYRDDTVNTHLNFGELTGPEGWHKVEPADVENADYVTIVGKTITKRDFDAGLVSDRYHEIVRRADKEREAIRKKIHNWYLATDQLKSDVDGLFEEAMANLRILAETRSFATLSESRTEKVIEAAGRTISVSRPDGEGHVRVTVEAKSYDLDFNAASGMVGLDPERSSNPETQLVAAGTNGKCVIEDGSLTITAERSLFDESAISFTVDDGTDKPTTHTVDFAATPEMPDASAVPRWHAAPNPPATSTLSTRSSPPPARDSLSNSVKAEPVAASDPAPDSAAGAHEANALSTPPATEPPSPLIPTTPDSGALSPDVAEPDAASGTEAAEPESASVAAESDVASSLAVVTASVPATDDVGAASGPAESDSVSVTVAEPDVAPSSAAESDSVSSSAVAEPDADSRPVAEPDVVSSAAASGPVVEPDAAPVADSSPAAAEPAAAPDPVATASDVGSGSVVAGSDVGSGLMATASGVDSGLVATGSEADSSSVATGSDVGSGSVVTGSGVGSGLMVTGSEAGSGSAATAADGGSGLAATEPEPGSAADGTSTSAVDVSTATVAPTPATDAPVPAIGESTPAAETSSNGERRGCLSGVLVPEQAGGDESAGSVPVMAGARTGTGWSVHGDLFGSGDPVYSMHGVLGEDDLESR